MDNQQVQQPGPINPEGSPNSSGQAYAPPQPAATPISTLPSKKSKKKLWTIIAVVVVVLAIIGAIGIKFALDVTAAPVKVSNQYVSDLLASNYSSAANLENSALTGSTPQTQINSTWQSYGLSNTTYTVVGKLVEKISGKEYASVVYKFASSGTSGYLEVQLVNTSSGWQVYGFSIIHSTTPTIH